MKRILNLFKRKESSLKDPKKKEWDLTKRNADKCKGGLKQIYGKEKSIIYSPHAKRVISKSPEIIKSFLDLFKSIKGIQTLTRQVTLKSGERVVYSLSRIPRPSFNSKVTTNFYVFEVLSPGNKSSKFFVKYVNLNKLALFFKTYTGVSEMLALAVIKKAGFNVVPSYFSYADKNKSFIFYKYQEKLMDAEHAYHQGLLDNKEIQDIRRKLRSAEKDVNKFYTQIKKRSKIYNDKKIKDIYPMPGKDFDALPVFIDFKTKKLFIYDPIFY